MVEAYQGPPRPADLIRRLMDQHGLMRADMVPILGTASRVSKKLTLTGRRYF